MLIFLHYCIWCINYIRFDSGKPNFQHDGACNGYHWVWSWIEIINKTSLRPPLGTEWVHAYCCKVVCDVSHFHFFILFWKSKHRKKCSHKRQDDSTFLFSWPLSISMPFVAWTVSPLHCFGGTPFQKKKKRKGICSSVFSFHSSWSEVLVLGLHNQEFMLKE